MTQEGLAERVEISASFMGHIERGSRKMSVDTLCRIAHALDCSADNLLGTGNVERNDVRLWLLDFLESMEQKMS